MRLGQSRQFSFRGDVCWAGGLALFCLLGVFWPHGSLPRTVAGLLLTLLLPGLALLIALGPDHFSLSPLERALVAPCLSLALVAVIGLGLNATPLGLRTEVVVVVLSCWTVIWLGVALLFNRHDASVVSIPGLVLTVLVLVGMSFIVQLPSTPHLDNPVRATSLALTTPAGALPSHAGTTVGTPYPLIADVRNGDSGSARYRLVARSNSVGPNIADVTSPQLHAGERWSIPLTVPAPTRAGDRQQLTVELYREGQSQPMRTTTLEIRVDE